jgi:deoxyinosine 3'endonuclease (endonuclease V)
MIAALDVHYDEVRSCGAGAAVLFRGWTDDVAAAEYTAVVESVQPYVPGNFSAGNFRACSR